MSAATVVIGSEVNELVAAHYLARAGHRVVVLEQHRSAADDGIVASGWVPPRIVRDLGLGDALAVERRDPWIAAALPDGERLELWSDPARSIEAIRRFSPWDAERWPAFCHAMSRSAQILEALYTAPPPDFMTTKFTESARLAASALRVRRLGRHGMAQFLRLLPMSVADFLDDHFRCEALKTLLGGAGILRLAQGPRSGGTALRLLHHHVGNPPGVFRPRASNIRQILARRPGIAVRHDARVSRIEVRDGRVGGVVLESGEAIDAAWIACGSDPRRLFLDWLEPEVLDAGFLRCVRHIRCRGVVARVRADVARSPGFGALTTAVSLDALERAYDHAKYGAISEHPYLEACVRGGSGEGVHVDIDVQYAPYRLSDGVWDAARRNALAERAVRTLDAAAPGFAKLVTACTVLAPPDLETRYGFPEGQAEHAEPALDQLLWMRPIPDWSSYRTPIAGLYLCGPGTHPGAAIAGAAGANAARIMLSDGRGRRSG
jgi:phytoene dehydrogenase-like protein